MGKRWPSRRHLLDRVGLLLVLPSATEAEQRAEVGRRNLVYQSAVRNTDPADCRLLTAVWDEELDLLRGLVRAAREQLPSVANRRSTSRSACAAALASEARTG
ncbi:MAG TPA: hypothetical protein VFU22_01075 [Roseiflexaceae bacterium]|nr:hypothetical protein [Roseiflexaceae bacterium]